LKRVIGIVGMPGSGKSIADEVAREFSFSVLIMGDIVREEVKKRGLILNPENIGKVMIKIRMEEGSAVVAKICITKINFSSTRVLIEGLRSLDEVHEFRKKFPNFSLIAIHASPKVRFHRIFGRNRSDDPKDWYVFQERDLREVNVGIGSVIALAEHMIINEGSLQSFKIKLRKCLKAILSE